VPTVRRRGGDGEPQPKSAGLPVPSNCAICLSLEPSEKRPANLACGRGRGFRGPHRQLKMRQAEACPRRLALFKTCGFARPGVRDWALVHESKAVQSYHYVCLYHVQRARGVRGGACRAAGQLPALRHGDSALHSNGPGSPAVSRNAAPTRTAIPAGPLKRTPPGATPGRGRRAALPPSQAGASTSPRGLFGPGPMISFLRGRGLTSLGSPILCYTYLCENAL